MSRKRAACAPKALFHVVRLQGHASGVPTAGSTCVNGSAAATSERVLST